MPDRGSRSRRTRNNGQLIASDGGIPNSHDCFFRTQIKRDQFVGLGDSDDVRDARKVFEMPAVDSTLVAGDANGCSRRAGHRMRPQPDFLDQFTTASTSCAEALGFITINIGLQGFGLFHWCKRQISRLREREKSASR